MGLGKTLTVISLMLKHAQQTGEEQAESDSDEDEDDLKHGGELSAIPVDHKPTNSLLPPGNLIICPASLVNQWEHEINLKVKRPNDNLRTHVFHGQKRTDKVNELLQHDVVVTSYNTVASEFKINGVLFKVRWKRIVLDEGHVIRNHKSKQSEAIFALESKYRWVLTGTPIQNKEMDVFATFKFLKAEPLDSLENWNFAKQNSNVALLPVILKTLLLRRTKEELMKTGEINPLPTKTVEKVKVTLNEEEKFIYTRVRMYSKKVFNEESKNLSTPPKTFELLLRMQQACCHPGLLKSMLEAGDLNDEDERVNREESTEDDFTDMLKEGDDGENRWSLNNPVFSLDRPSSKIEHMMEVLREEVLPTGDKAIAGDRECLLLRTERNRAAEGQKRHRAEVQRSTVEHSSDVAVVDCRWRWIELGWRKLHAVDGSAL
jgi:transcription termination factor 2